MTRTFAIFSVLSAVALTGLISGCKPGGVGDPCVPEDEYAPDFSGFAYEEVNVESRSFQCETRVCLVNHFQGRVSCPYGNSKGKIREGSNPPDCHIPGSATEALAPDLAVDPQLKERQASKTVYCSCRCAGPDANARYCDCPSGFRCYKLVDKLPIGKGGQLAGSYCIKESTEFVKGEGELSTTCAYGSQKSENTYCGEVDSITGAPLD